jgi:peptidoglycan hydrolase-like protein with peptidoglycan-binding domain
MNSKIKYLLFTAVLATAVLCSPIVASAAGLTTIQINAIIGMLQAFGADSSTIANVQIALNGGTPITPPITWCHTFNKNLKVGDSGNEIQALQIALENEEVLTISAVNDDKGMAANPNYFYFGKNTTVAVSMFQSKYGMTPVGQVGPKTRAKLNALYGCRTIPQNITINSVSGPNSLNIGQTGYWTVNATAPSGTNLTYSVNWGDGYQPLDAPTGYGFNSSQTSTFTHAYNQAGMYTVKFDISDGYVCSKTGGIACDSTGHYAETSLTVVVGNSTSPSVTVTSPNGGETLVRGQTYNITWTSQGSIANNVDIRLVEVSKNSPYNTFYIIKNININQHTYGWNVGYVYSSAFNPANNDAVLEYPSWSGQYKIQICEAGTSNCDSSDNYFTISQ